MSPWLSDLFLGSQPDERLVALVREGRDRAFAVIVDRYRAELTAYAARIAADAVAEDIVQQAFLSAFVALRSGTDVLHLRGWLYQIVRNGSFRTAGQAESPLHEVDAPTESVAEVVEHRMTAIGALAAMSRLPDRQREAIIATAIGGTARSEIAESMGLSEGAVRQLVHRARLQLRAAAAAVIPAPLLRFFVSRPAAGVQAERVATVTSASGAAIKIGTLVVTGAAATGLATTALPHLWRHSPTTHAVIEASRATDVDGVVSTSPSTAAPAGLRTWHPAAPSARTVVAHTSAHGSTVKLHWSSVREANPGETGAGSGAGSAGSSATGAMPVAPAPPHAPTGSMNGASGSTTVKPPSGGSGSSAGSAPGGSTSGGTATAPGDPTSGDAGEEPGGATGSDTGAGGSATGGGGSTTSGGSGDDGSGDTSTGSGSTGVGTGPDDSAPGTGEGSGRGASPPGASPGGGSGSDGN